MTTATATRPPAPATDADRRAAHIARIVAAAPPLTAEQRAHLARLLRRP